MKKNISFACITSKRYKNQLSPAVTSNIYALSRETNLQLIETNEILVNAAY